MILILLYIFSLFIISTPGFFIKQTLNTQTFILNALFFLIIFTLTFPLVNDIKEGYSYKIQLNGVDNFIELLETYLHDSQIEKTVNITSDFNKYKCNDEMEKLKEENKLLSQGFNISPS